jgi:two-component system sensor histidine kinase AtoS
MPTPDLESIVRATCRTALRHCNSTCSFHFAAQTLPSGISSERLKQALVPLFINAAESMRSGGVIAVQSRIVRGNQRGDPPLPEADFVCISIADAGAGIRPEDLPHIFTPGFSTRPGHAGTGLCEAREIVERLGGVIHVDSTPAKGTKVAVYLPLTQT